MWQMPFLTAHQSGAASTVVNPGKDWEPSHSSFQKGSKKYQICLWGCLIYLTRQAHKKKNQNLHKNWFIFEEFSSLSLGFFFFFPNMWHRNFKKRNWKDIQSNTWICVARLFFLGISTEEARQSSQSWLGVSFGCQYFQKTKNYSKTHLQHISHQVYD